jgi:hypothetical protein
MRSLDVPIYIHAISVYSESKQYVTANIQYGDATPNLPKTEIIN